MFEELKFEIVDCSKVTKVDEMSMQWYYAVAEPQKIRRFFVYLRLPSPQRLLQIPPVLTL